MIVWGGFAGSGVYFNNGGRYNPATNTWKDITPPEVHCNLFGDDFNDGDYNGWSVGNGTWEVIGGKLQVRNITSGRVGYADHQLPVPNFFRLTLDVEAENFNGSFYGFEPWSSTQTFTLGSRTVDGLGAVVLSDGRVGFFGYDVNSNVWVAINAGQYGPVSSLGVEWASNHFALIVNGSVVDTINVTLSAPRLDTLSLIGTGTTTKLRFDNVCQRSPQVLVFANGLRAAAHQMRGSTQDLRLIKARLASIVEVEIPSKR